MDEQDDWLEGVRRWYFGGEAPAEAGYREDSLTWPSSQTSTRCGHCNEHIVRVDAIAKSSLDKTANVH